MNEESPYSKSQFLGYEDESNTFYIVPDIRGSTKVIFTHAGTIVNRLDYDTLGKVRNQDTTPQVELLWRSKFEINSLLAYVNNYHTIYFSDVGYYFPISNNNDFPLSIVDDVNPLNFSDAVFILEFYVQIIDRIPLSAGCSGAPRGGKPHCYHIRIGTETKLICHWPDCSETEGPWVEAERIYNHSFVEVRGEQK